MEIPANEKSMSYGPSSVSNIHVKQAFTNPLTLQI